MKLTLAGKVVGGVFILLVCVLAYFLFFKPDPPPPTDTQGRLIEQAASKPPKPFKFPLSGEQITAWERAAAPNRTKLDYCSFMTQARGGIYEQSRAAKLDFVGIIPENVIQSPYYYRDRETGREYYPVYPVGPGSDGLQQALGAVNQDPEAIPGCAKDVKGAVPVVVAFPKGSNPPSDRVVRVLGYMAWQLGYLDRGTKATAPEATVVNAGRISSASLQQALSPSTRERVLNIAVRRGPVVMRVSRVEFTPSQTRVWMELWNTSAEPLDGYSGVTGATLQERGQAEVQAGSAELEGTQDIGSIKNPSDILPSEDIPPAANRSSKLDGYITFPAVDPTKQLTLNLPDPYETSGQAAAISLSFNPRKNQPLE